MKSIYNKKQASHNWNIHFDGFSKNIDVYKKVNGSTVTFLILYLDDILRIGNDVGAMSSMKIW